MSVTLYDSESQDLIDRATPHISKMYPIKELINGKNVLVDYEFKRISRRLAITELQKGEQKPRKYIIWAVLESLEKKVATELLIDVVEYFEALHSSH